MENIEDIENSNKEYYVNPTISILESLLRRVGKIKLYKQWFSGGKHLKLEYSNKKDDRAFIKIYMDKKLLKDLLSLSSSTSALLYFIMDTIETGKDSIILNRDHFVKTTDLSEGSFYASVKELLDKEWIFKSTTKNFYWINLTRFNKGTAEEVFKNFELNKAKEVLV